jgi:hypothetical protein
MTKLLDWLFRRQQSTWTPLQRALVSVAISDASCPRGWWRQR